jgi:hypothetical protein
MRKQPSASSQWKLPLWVPTRLPFPAPLKEPPSAAAGADEKTLRRLGEAAPAAAAMGKGFGIWERARGRNVTARCDSLQAQAASIIVERTMG